MDNVDDVVKYGICGYSDQMYRSIIQVIEFILDCEKNDGSDVEMLRIIGWLHEKWIVCNVMVWPIGGCMYMVMVLS